MRIAGRAHIGPLPRLTLDTGRPGPLRRRWRARLGRVMLSYSVTKNLADALENSTTLEGRFGPSVGKFDNGGHLNFFLSVDPGGRRKKI